MLVPRPQRDRQRGNSLLLALIVLSSLATLGSLTVVSVQSTLKASTNDRSQTVAMYAAESGGAAAMEFLRNNFNATTGWTAFVVPGTFPGPAPRVLSELPSSGALPGTSNNVFSIDQNASFTIAIINNRSDSGYGAGLDNDGIVTIQATGRGPQGSLAVIEWEVQRVAPQPPSPAPPLPPDPPPPAPWLTPPNVPPGANAGLHIRSWRAVL